MTFNSASNCTDPLHDISLVRISLFSPQYTQSVCVCVASVLDCALCRTVRQWYTLIQCWSAKHTCGVLQLDSFHPPTELPGLMNEWPQQTTQPLIHWAHHRWEISAICCDPHWGCTCQIHTHHGPRRRFVSEHWVIWTEPRHLSG